MLELRVLPVVTILLAALAMLMAPAVSTVPGKMCVVVVWTSL